MTSIRRARPGDAPGIAAVHVATWRSAYPGILPEDYLANLSPSRIAASYQRGLFERRDGEAVFVAVAPPAEGEAPQIVGFASGGRLRRPGGPRTRGEIETLYVLDDWRDQGVGRRLIRATAAHLSVIGCCSARLCVLSDNPARWFYQRLGGRVVERETIRVGGQEVEQTALVWDPIELLLAATARADGA
jgi:ribosomal protein S18 acetylase RimI-like enzyme